jgi:hypothetical protein
MIEPAVAFWVNVFWLNQSPCKRPGRFLIQRIICKSIRIIFGNNSCGGTRIQAKSKDKNHQKDETSKAFGRNHIICFKEI